MDNILIEFWNNLIFINSSNKAGTSFTFLYGKPPYSTNSGLPPNQQKYLASHKLKLQLEHLNRIIFTCCYINIIRLVLMPVFRIQRWDNVNVIKCFVSSP